MYTDSQIKPLLALVAEISSMSAADGCADGYTITSGPAVATAANVAASLSAGGMNLVVGQHDHRHGSSYYAFLVPNGASFTEDDFREHLGAEFEPNREEFANTIDIPDSEVVVVNVTDEPPQVDSDDGEALEELISAAKQHGEDSDPDHEVGDLQDFLRAMWGLLTPEQRIAYRGLPAVRETYANANATGDDE